jgi:hypothetical protein
MRTYLSTDGLCVKLRVTKVLIFLEEAYFQAVADPPHYSTSRSQVY